ncbi:hypothetical protein ACFU8T_20775 [Sphingobacterium spiritivorum]|uniref:Uncharacterized protein n=1 Tax=Sphingobacterium spiritivorum ATCC 33861 TaxID=525373 RepID=D7VG98_SPHSI|nr:hypothetical protein [Sphingobacterium spiritivorum]EFK60073.1 hypothetical protein HMPREF0766_10017 [Sphingobacterium spiritivorum ATCC 33861]QQT34791.1 hypothetical protein I6J01_16010 [Sphingobacterium spiritivorum]WQD35679.1 hypothetical protein U0038_07960 [Sphingobacterium spiritivorum]SUJ01482.1 Uncharacterised protein [Sphingobacterium spiritivorum]
MNVKIARAVTQGLETYAANEGHDHQELLNRLHQAFDAQKPFLEKVDLLDAAFDDHMRFDELREICFDLLLMNFFSEDVQKLEEDYLDSPEWESIEDQTIDRGTELLNIFLYLRECADDEIEPELEDYLKEFLLVDEDEFQDEHRIYEKVIANQILVDSSYAEIAKVAETVDNQDELYEVFYPMMSFFSESNPSEKQLEEYKSAALNKSLDLALYQIIINYNK